MVLIVKWGFGTMLSDKKDLQSHWKPIVKDRADCKVGVLGPVFKRFTLQLGSEQL